MIVDSDADLDEVVPALIKSAFVYAGQKCSAAARVLAHDAIADTLTERLAGAVEVLRVGQADTFGTDVPPVIDDEAQQRVLEYIDIARRDGRIAAQRPAGGGEGHFVPPTLAVDLPPDSPVLRDEIFGPVLAVIPYADEDDAVRVANDSDYGLSGSVWTADVDRGLAVARRIRTGTLGVNQAYSMDPAAPFGGVKSSGLGRELGPEGLDEYLTLKSISVDGGLP